MKKANFGIALVVSAVCVLGSQAFLTTVPLADAQAASTQSENNIRSAVLNAIKKPEFSNVRVTVKGGVVDLEGSVKDVATKEELDRRTHRVKNVVAVRNEVQISGAGSVSDAQLRNTLVGKIEYDRIGYWGTTPYIRDVTPFNAIAVNVSNGVVTLGGHAYDPESADSAVSVASRTPGVRDVIDNIQVDPVSNIDDHLRVQLFRSIYGYPQLNKYAIDPGKPIRINVVNGKVTLYGQVMNQADKEVAGVRAKLVPGVFSVTNDLQVASQPTER